MPVRSPASGEPRGAPGSRSDQEASDRRERIGQDPEREDRLVKSRSSLWVRAVSLLTARVFLMGTSWKRSRAYVPLYVPEMRAPSACRASVPAPPVSPLN